MPPRLTKRWVLHDTIPSEVDLSLQSQGIQYPSFRQILYGRGILDGHQALAYLEGKVEEGQDDPYLLKDMQDTAKRLQWAIKQGELIAVYGDFDVDGVTATALLTQALRRFGAQVIPYIPDRFEEGYGLNVTALETLAGQNVRLVVTVDCGIRSPEEATHAEKLGIDLIISDHHQPSAEIPNAYAVICPKQEGDTYPFKDLAGVGIAYKIAQALGMLMPEAGVRVDEFLDLVALGTVADVAPLVGENRSLVQRGLEVMRQCTADSRPGLLSLANLARLKIDRVTAGDIAFILGPRLNAAGRVNTARDSLDLLMCDNMQDAGLLSQNLDNQNRERQEMTRKTQERAIETFQSSGIGPILFTFHQDYSSGIVGLVASRLVETYYRPAIVGHIEGEYTRASCRSIPEFHITEALDQCSSLLVRHGGHALAAGFTVHNDNVPALVEQLSAIAADKLSSQELCPVLYADRELNLSEIPSKQLLTFIGYLDRLEPTGQGNPEATFISRDLEVINAWTVGAEKQHLRVKIKAGREIFDAIAFRQGHWVNAMPKRIDMLYKCERNEYNGQVSLQLNVRDFRPVSQLE